MGKLSPMSPAGINAHVGRVPCPHGQSTKKEPGRGFIVLYHGTTQFTSQSLSDTQGKCGEILSGVKLLARVHCHIYCA